MGVTGGLVTLILSVLFLAVIFLICRAIVLWYWKVGRVIILLESIDKKLGSSQIPPIP